MSPLRHIVAATDLSPSARHAADRAAQLARATGASLTLLNSLGGSAWEDLRRLLASDDVEQAMTGKARQALSAEAARVKQEHPVEIEERVGTGHPVEEIAALAESERAGLIVCGAGGEAGERWLLGSTAERVVRTALRPVLLVRQAVNGPYTRLLVPVDFSFWSESSIHIARQLAPAAHLVLLHSLDTSMTDRMRLDGVDSAVIQRYRDAARQEAEARLADLAARVGLGPNDWTPSITADSDPWTAIVAQQKAQGCDLTVIGKQGRSALGEFVLGSVTRKVITGTTGDVLVAARGETLVPGAEERP